jgi:hypothetical protein
VKILVYMRDGRTVYRIAKRGLLAELLTREPAHEERGIAVERAYWNPVTGTFTFWHEVRLRFLSKNSVAVVEEAPREEA